MACSFLCAAAEPVAGLAEAGRLTQASGQRPSSNPSTWARRKRQAPMMAGSSCTKVLDMKIAEYIVEEEPEPDLDYQHALILAMQREKQAFRLYTDLAELTDSSELKEVFLSLAQEEAKHKLRFEIEYEENVLQDN